MLVFPEIDPVALQLGPLAIRWYGLAYVAGMLGGLVWLKRIVAQFPVAGQRASMVDDLFTWVIVGVVAGGRLGFVLFYALPTYGVDLLLVDPTFPFRIWEGGMSFHGGVLGVVLAVVLFSRKYALNPFDVGDRLVVVLPLGLFLGRIANFINGEIWGRPAPEGLPWGMVFPHVDALVRHPAQIYAALSEGVALGVVLWLVTRRGFTRYQAIGVFLAGYAVARIVNESFRNPHIIHTWAGLEITHGQLLSLPMLLVGLVFMRMAVRR